MTTINRKEFVSDLSKGVINVNDMSAETKEKLSKAGITQKDLVEIAGRDGQISGQEYQRLFNLVDTSIVWFFPDMAMRSEPLAVMTEAQCGSPTSNDWRASFRKVHLKWNTLQSPRVFAQVEPTSKT